jgi:hypothetical protein
MFSLPDAGRGGRAIWAALAFRFFFALCCSSSSCFPLSAFRRRLSFARISSAIESGFFFAGFRVFVRRCFASPNFLSFVLFRMSAKKAAGFAVFPEGFLLRCTWADCSSACSTDGGWPSRAALRRARGGSGGGGGGPPPAAGVGAAAGAGGL